MHRITKLLALLFCLSSRIKRFVCADGLLSTIIWTFTPRRWAATSFLAVLSMSKRNWAIRIVEPLGATSIDLLSVVMMASFWAVEPRGLLNTKPVLGE